METSGVNITFELNYVEELANYNGTTPSGTDSSSVNRLLSWLGKNPQDR